MNISKNHNKTIVAVFAHPDDEAFGPAGTLAKLANNFKVYILCATKGEAGIGEKLAQIRSAELQHSAKILGIKRVHFLGFSDGTLCNAVYHQLAEKISKRLSLYKPETIITFEPRGISGHIDHVTVSLATTYVFYRLPFIKTLLYYCISNAERKLIKDYFIYFPPGYKNDEIDKVVDIKRHWLQKVQAMRAHKSQKKDADTILKMLSKLPKEEYFLVLNKP